jgi:hypothetical protein
MTGKAQASEPAAPKAPQNLIVKMLYLRDAPDRRITQPLISFADYFWRFSTEERGTGHLRLI